VILPAQTIRQLCKEPPIVKRNCRPMIDPFFERAESHGMSFGLSSAGYDICIGEYTVIHPNSFYLAVSLERFVIPDNILVVVHDKSSWARQGLFVQNTVIDPGWEGYLTLELSNSTRYATFVIRAGTPIAQLIFHRLENPTLQPYSGKYQDQGPKPQPAIYDD
jgi:dCTP deaminase